ncbi:MAG TPA: AAA family ATPase [Eubacteriales bacterium]|nr:AAA family ATPase [Eubacteriales bacterium]
MEFNTPMRFVMVRAAAEVNASKATQMFPEHVLLGILKLAELKTEEFAPTSKHVAESDADIKKVRALLRAKKIDTQKTRVQLRRILSSSQPEGDAEGMIAVLMMNASRGKDVITAEAVTAELFARPTPIIRSLLAKPGKADATEDTGEGELSDSEEKPSEEMDISFLPKLTDRVRGMRYALLNTVLGQDHAVHAFAEGIFSAEVIAASDEKRKHPRAIFVFAGPPGVGKTFLADQAAQTLKLPFKKFEMTAFADELGVNVLVGFPPSFKDAKEGTLTGFVAENPHCILLFDEIEKANAKVIHLFLQILDAGNLHDSFNDTDVSFKDTIIIFTTNAGKQLYEGDQKINAAGLPRQTIINALETDNDPKTGLPYFPPAICSRLATGYPIMFNHLQAYDLERIIANELSRLCGLFEKQYGIKVETQPLVATTLLFAEGGQADARTVRAQAELFFKNEVFKLCRLWSQESFEEAIKEIGEIAYTVEESAITPEVNSLFCASDTPEVLVFGNPGFAERCRSSLPNIRFHNAETGEAAFKIAGEQEITLVLMDVVTRAALLADENEETDFAEDPMLQDKTAAAFDNVPIASMSLKTARTFFRNMRERFPEMPVYLLETEFLVIDAELMTSFARAGARGKLTIPSGDIGVFGEELSHICAQVYMQESAAKLHAEHKVLYYETAPILSKDKKTATIRIRDLSLKRALSAEDAGEVLDEVEKPSIRFDDVIGAADAKDELTFFVDFLKNPKAFAARGLKPPKGVLLYGPPGTGKTMLAKAMAGESNVAFIPAVGSAFVTKFQGSGPEAVRALFRRARRYAPAIIFIDELDAVGRARGNTPSGFSGHGEEMTLNALLAEMDGFSVDPKRPVFVLAATNFDAEEGQGGIGAIDAALARRFDRRIRVDLPNKENRKQFLERMLKKQKDAEVSEGMIETIAGRSAGLSLASLSSVIDLAARMAAKKNSAMTDAILDEAFELTRHGEKKDWGKEYVERVARHESGHAYLCYKAGKTPAYLTIEARGSHGGYMEHADTESQPLLKKEELIGRIRTSLGGRAAEMVYYGTTDGVSTGASGDLQNATQIARAMICSYGMDEAVGLMTLTPEEAQSGPMAKLVNDRINEMLKAELKITMEIIAAGREKIDRLVEKLMEKNKLTREEIEELLKD